MERNPLDRAAVARVDALIGPLSEQDVNQQAAAARRLFAAYGRPRNGRTAARAGARIDTRSADRVNLLHAAPKAEPRRHRPAGDQPRRAVARAGRAAAGHQPDGRAPQLSLLELARQRGDTALEALLCANGADGC